MQAIVLLHIDSVKFIIFPASVDVDKENRSAIGRRDAFDVENFLVDAAFS